MTKQEIIGEWARNRIVEQLLSTQTRHNGNPYIGDLAQDIYIILLNEDDELVERLYREGALAYYTIRIIKNNLCSTTSEFYYKYQRFRKLTNELPETI